MEVLDVPIKVGSILTQTVHNERPNDKRNNSNLISSVIGDIKIIEKDANNEAKVQRKIHTEVKPEETKPKENQNKHCKDAENEASSGQEPVDLTLPTTQPPSQKAMDRLGNNLKLVKKSTMG